jgi:glycine reductase
MRLSLHVHHVSRLAWGGASRLSEGTLEVDRGALADELMRDERLASVELELVQAGESCRILPVFDVVEPRHKPESGASDFPGALGPIRQVGAGVTTVLRGMAVSLLNPDVDPDAVVPGRLPVIDMAGSPLPGCTAAEANRYAGLCHLAVIPRFAAGLTATERLDAMRRVSLRAAAWLGALASGEPDEVEDYELTPTPPELPRVAYIFQMHSHQRPTLPGEPMLYGDNCRFLLPTIVQPNELLDGAMVTPYQTTAVETYAIQNHAVILDLYRRHGRDLTFPGVVVTVASQLPEEKQRTTILAANLVRYGLRAGGAVCSKAPGGAANADMALVAERCEELGVRTSLLVSESSVDGEGDTFMLFNQPSLNAVVSIESGLGETLPPVERVVATSPALAERYQGAQSPKAFNNVGIKDYLGGGRVAVAQY